LKHFYLHQNSTYDIIDPNEAKRQLRAGATSGSEPALGVTYLTYGNRLKARTGNQVLAGATILRPAHRLYELEDDWRPA
jgi:hypothetical protein